VSTDFHGHGEDFRRLEDLFFQHLHRDPLTQWLILGDLIHGPDIRTAREIPELYGYWDESAWIIKRLLQLMDVYPDQIHLILGNHDYAHIGGKHTRKFHPDEVTYLEAQMHPEEILAMHKLFSKSYLAASTPSGLLLTHGSPNLSLTSLSQLDNIDLSVRNRTPWEQDVLQGLLWAYGQNDYIAGEMLRVCSQEFPAQHPLKFIIHGHDRDEHGWFIEGQYQLCVVLFGALRVHKRYLVINLAHDYQTIDELTKPAIMRNLYPSQSIGKSSSTS